MLLKLSMCGLSVGYGMLSSIELRFLLHEANVNVLERAASYRRKLLVGHCSNTHTWLRQGPIFERCRRVSKWAGRQSLVGS